jgi:hypothetical protein
LVGRMREDGRVEGTARGSFGSVILSARQRPFLPTLGKDEPAYIYSNADPETDRIMVVATTPNLLQNLGRSSKSVLGGIVSVDGTYKVNKNGFPVLTLGTVCYSTTLTS